MISNGIKRAKAINSQELRRPKNTVIDTNQILPYVSSYNPRNTEAFTIINQNVQTLMKDQRMKSALATQKIIKSKRRSKSLKKLLTSAKLSKDDSIPSVKNADVQIAVFVKI